MVYDDFVILVQRQDSRNVFQPCDSDLSFVPVPLRSFYITYNPVDVEILLADSTSVRFSPVKHLKKLQDEYDINDSSFIFATKDGDPIYFKFDGVFIGTHGSSIFKENKLSDNFDSYIEMLSNEMIEKMRKM